MSARRMILILGGARSGKSDYAQKQAAALGGKVAYLATAEAGDAEMETRIRNHRAARPPGWTTLETPREVGKAAAALAPRPDVVLLDCLTLLTSNCLMALPEPPDEDDAQRLLDAELDGILEAYEQMNAVWIVVSNEVGLGLVPANALGRIYRDVLGRANQRLAALADEVVFLAAGLPLYLKPRGSV